MHSQENLNAIIRKLYLDIFDHLPRIHCFVVSFRGRCTQDSRTYKTIMMTRDILSVLIILYEVQIVLLYSTDHFKPILIPTQYTADFGTTVDVIVPSSSDVVCAAHCNIRAWCRAIIRLNEYECRITDAIVSPNYDPDPTLVPFVPCFTRLVHDFYKDIVAVFASPHKPIHPAEYAFDGFWPKFAGDFSMTFIVPDTYLLIDLGKPHVVSSLTFYKMVSYYAFVYFSLDILNGATGDFTGYDFIGNTTVTKENVFSNNMPSFTRYIGFYSPTNYNFGLRYIAIA